MLARTVPIWQPPRLPPPCCRRRRRPATRRRACTDPSVRHGPDASGLSRTRARLQDSVVARERHAGVSASPRRLAAPRGAAGRPRTGQPPSPPTRSGSTRRPPSESTRPGRSSREPAAAALSPQRPPRTRWAACSPPRRRRLSRYRRKPDRPDVGRLQFFDGPRDVHHGRDAHVVDRAGRRLGRRAVERRGMPRLPHHAIGARRIHRSENRADVLRILDAVEHHEQARALAPQPPVRRPCTPPAAAVRRPRPGARRRGSAARGRADRAVSIANRNSCARATRASTRGPAPRSWTSLRDTPRLQRFGDCLNAVNDRHDFDRPDYLKSATRADCPPTKTRGPMLLPPADRAHDLDGPLGT